MINFYLLGLSFIVLHEMDAIRCKEWRIFPGLSLLNDQLGFIVFLFTHIPLTYWIFYELNNDNPLFRMGFDYFLIIHLFLHLLFLKHQKNEFRDWISWVIIIGAAICGGLDLLFLP